MRSVHIKAFLPASLIEYPGRIADVLYVGACNFRCPYCYNVELVLRPDLLPDLQPVEVLRKLALRGGFVDGVVISGGEPTLQPDLLPFLLRVRQLGLSVKLDTNGYRPDVLRACLEQKVLDYVAMDVKSSLARYHEAAGVRLDVRRVQESIALILSSDIDYEFRTTIVPTLVDAADVQAIVPLIAGARRYYLQCFRPVDTVGWGREPPVAMPPAELLHEMANLAAGHVQEVGVRGLP
ncbi:MAG: anaerobic ribonucleoside-triphosphate reductase activating protein [Chloroflexi bacterium]|nr:anaerobic ribonucleoside-triphosphate reductase activating protein [Chloroflexota bacterium]